ncbi:hypothetical protein G6F35_014562 [Rhizopus arrhizus]|nr:hypothetical protein G6F31_014387 [Rhizopus arrhizus]KAG1186861.1 hypothetical protein G6F35_014562 [Rhizopus arrhizus]KAG1275858.1 hypothetical protein G6F65_009620 [Rhizopus arrhizus]
MLFDQGVLQVQQVVIAADLLPEFARLAGIGRAEQFFAPCSGHASERLAAVGPGVQPDGEVMPTPLLAVLPPNGQVVLLSRYRILTESDPEAVCHDAPDILDSVEPGKLGFGLVACGSPVLHRRTSRPLRAAARKRRAWECLPVALAGQ